MKASEIRSKYLKFYSARGHAIIPAAPIIPPDDPTTLFTSSGMQQLVPYLKGETHSMGTRLTDSQPSFRAEDIEEVGDNRHTTMFEMLGNWSLGDYFKKEQLPWVYEFFTKEIGLEKDRLHVTLFEGDAFAAKDTESYDIWKGVGVANDHIHYYPGKKNWWSRAGIPANMPVGEIGGPDSEVFYDFGAELNLHENSPFKNESCHVNCDCGRYLEIGNSVFMQFVKTENGLEPLPKQNVDFGGGLERIAAASQNTPDVFMIDMFAPIIKSIEESSGKKYLGNESAMRVIADHLRAAVLMIGQGIMPSNKLQGYVLRRLLRRAAVRSRKLGADTITIFNKCITDIALEYNDAGYISGNVLGISNIQFVVNDELNKFNKALDHGLKELDKYTEKAKSEKWIPNAESLAKVAFDFHQSYGFPIDIFLDLWKPIFITLGWDNDELLVEYFEKYRKEHIEKSRTASAGMFKGGLADQSEITTKYHTTTHLLHQALRDVLGDEISQAGSNITSERLRFDYSYSGKPTPEQLEKIGKIVNEKIAADLPVKKTIEDKKEAIASGARAFFAEKYPDKVSVYTIGTYSKELCGGPHVEHTGLIGKIEIVKDESLGTGKRRIYAKLKV